MKQKIISVCLAVCIAAVALAGASLAYFTAQDDAVNTFTVGNVKIDLIESVYCRPGNGDSGDASVPNPDNRAEGMRYVADGTPVFTDGEIQADAENYIAYLSDCGANMVPGRNAAKCPYVINTGTNDAYIRIRVRIPSAANGDFVDAEEGGIITGQWCSACIASGEFIDGKGGGRDCAPFINRGVEADGIRYDEYIFVRAEPLSPGAMTEWNVWDCIGISENATAADIQTAIGLGAVSADNDGNMSFRIPVEADAIQAQGFADALAAFAAFDAA